MKFQKMFGNQISFRKLFFPLDLRGSSPSPPGKNIWGNVLEDVCLIVIRRQRNATQVMSPCGVKNKSFRKKKDFGNLSLQEAGGKGALRR